MSQEVFTLGNYPYRAIVHLTITFPDGVRVIGSGALVGRNDILTATHVLYDPERGGWASDIRIAVGADYNSSIGRYETPSLVELPRFTWEAKGWPQQTFTDTNNDTLTWSESRYDVALIGLDQAIGDQVGWFGMAAGYDSPQWAYQIGYPSGSSGMMLGEAWIERSHYYSVYNAYASSGSDIMGPGSSGGPLFVYDNDAPYIIGVKSSGSTTASTWADIGLLYSQLVDFIDYNDYLLPSNTDDSHTNSPDDSPTSTDDSPISSPVDWRDRSLDEFVKTLGTLKADTLRGSIADDLLVGLQGKDTLIGGDGSDRLEGGAGNDILQGGSNQDILIGGAGRDLYLWSRDDLQADTRDLLIDGKGSRLQLDDGLLTQLMRNGTPLDSLPRKQTVGNTIDTENSLAWTDRHLQIDLNGDGIFDATQDFSIEIVGNGNRVYFDARSDLLILG